MTHANRLAVLTQIKIRAAIIAEIFRKSARMSIECARRPAARPAPRAAASQHCACAANAVASSHA
jgi:hypothetical protein